MTAARKLKQSIRARAAKTGESYTTARAQVLKARQRREPRPPAPPAPPAPPPRPAVSSGLSEQAVVAKTGHGFDHWFAVLDRFDAPAKGHTAAARHLANDHGIPGWHSQGITVAYERARGLRAVNQAATGFQVSVSKMVPVSLDTALAALRAPARDRWLSAADPELRRALETALAGDTVVRGPKRSRVRYKWDGSSVELVFEPRGKGTSVVASNTKLPDAVQVERRRAQWREALDLFKSYLSR